MLYTATAVLAAPATIERRTSYTGGTTANDVVNKGPKHNEASFDGVSLTVHSTMYTSDVHLCPWIY